MTRQKKINWVTACLKMAGAMSYFPADTFAGIVCGVTAYAENETWRITITADDSTIRGDGSKDSPYEITTAEQLFAVMKKSETKYAVLKDDIVINKDLLNRIDKDGEPSDTSDSIVCWTPISDDVFCKTNLDGGNHKISGLYINESGKAGLYASLKEGSFKNLIITDSFVKGGNNVGVLNALDASAVLKSVIGISQGANPLMGDFNNDGTVNAIDASDILKWIIRS